MPSYYHFCQFPTATDTEKQGTVPHPHDITRFANIPSVDSCNTFFAKKRTLGEDFGTSHKLPFVVSLAPMLSLMAESLGVFTTTLSEWQEQRQVRWVQHIMYDMVCQLSLLVETFSVYHHPVELSWEIARCVAYERTTFWFTNTVDLSLPIALRVTVCECVWGRMNGEKQTVCLHACSVCVCVCRTLCSQLKGASKYMELEQQPRFPIL